METGLISIEVVCRLHNIAVDIASLKRQYFINRELEVAELMRAFKDAGFRVGLRKFKSVIDLEKYVPPFIFLRKDGTYNVFLSAKAGKFLVFDCEQKKPLELSQEEFCELWTGQIIAVFPRLMQGQLYLSFKWLFREFLRYRTIFTEVVLSSFFVQIFGLVTPLFFQIIIDKVLAHGAVTTLQVIAVVFLAVIIFDTILNLLRNYLLYHTANKIDAGLGSKVYRHLLSIPFNYFETRKVGNIIARVRELENLRQFMTNISLTVLLDTLFSIVFVVVMCFYSVALTVMVLGFIAVIALISFTVTPIIKSRLDDKFQKGAQSQSFLVESITGVQTVKSLAIEGKMTRNWENYLGEYILAAFKVQNLGNTAYTSSQAVQKLMTLAVIYFGVGYVLANELSVGQLIAFQMFSSQLSGPILRLVHSWQDFQQASLSLERLGDIVNTPSEVVEGNITVKEIKGDISFDNVSFKYGLDGPPVLDGVSFKIPTGSMVGIVGRSGSGKSTIIKLIQRLYLPVDGAIYIDGVDVRHYNPMFLRYKMGVVPQECFLFSGTIKENITMAMPNAPMELVIQVAKLAGAHQFIAEMPKGYDTVVEERGASLSGGQRQRIAIARALIANPKIIIFDEATSALDYESEKIIQDSMQLIKKGRTVIVIAHRLSTMRNCD